MDQQKEAFYTVKYIKLLNLLNKKATILGGLLFKLTAILLI